MGCCYSSDDDKNSQNGDVNETSRLLANPVGNNQSRPGSHDDYGHHGHYGSSTQKGDEQSQLSRILHQTATNVIDVSALDSHNLEQNEYMDRARLYREGILAHVTASSSKFYQSGRDSWLLSDVPAVDRILNAEPVPPSDLDLINSIARKASRAIEDIRVEHKEDLVVQFGIP